MMAERNKILILEDNPDHQFIYEQVLGYYYQLTFVDSIKGFFHNIAQNRFNLAIVDLNLKDGIFQGFNELTQSSLPYIVITLHDDPNLIRKILDHGAKDFLVKPFNKSELLVKVERALLSKGESSSEIQSLTPKEKLIFNALLNAESKMLSRERLHSLLWNNVKVHPNALDVHLYKLRKKIKDFGYVIEKYGNGDWKLTHEKEL